MSRPPYQLCLDRAHCPLAKTRAFIRTDDSTKPHVCPLAKPECVRELCDIPRAKRGLGLWLLTVPVLVASAAALAWQKGWLPKEWMAELGQTATFAAPVTAQPAAEQAALQKQKQEAAAAVAALQKEREKDQAARLRAEQEAASARAEVAKIKQEAPGHAPTPAPPASPKSAPPAGTVSDDLAKFFPGTQTKP